jgi:hypothetical protein
VAAANKSETHDTRPADQGRKSGREESMEGRGGIDCGGEELNRREGGGNDDGNARMGVARVEG